MVFRKFRNVHDIPQFIVLKIRNPGEFCVCELLYFAWNLSVWQNHRRKPGFVTSRLLERHTISPCFYVRKITLESVHNNLVRKMRPHIGGQVLHPTNLRKSSERVTHNRRLHYVSLMLCMTRSEDFLKFVGCKTWSSICGLIFRTKL